MEIVKLDNRRELSARVIQLLIQLTVFAALCCSVLPISILKLGDVS